MTNIENQAEELYQHQRREGKTENMIRNVVLEAKIGDNPIIVVGHTMDNCLNHLRPRIIDALDRAGFQVVSSRRETIRFHDKDGNENSIRLAVPQWAERTENKVGRNAKTFFDNSVFDCARSYYVRNQPRPDQERDFYQQRLGIPYTPPESDK